MKYRKFLVFCLITVLIASTLTGFKSVSAKGLLSEEETVEASLEETEDFTEEEQELLEDEDLIQLGDWTFIMPEGWSAEIDEPYIDITNEDMDNVFIGVCYQTISISDIAMLKEIFGSYEDLEFDEDSEEIEEESEEESETESSEEAEEDETEEAIEDTEEIEAEESAEESEASDERSEEEIKELYYWMFNYTASDMAEMNGLDVKIYNHCKINGKPAAILYIGETEDALGAVMCMIGGTNTIFEASFSYEKAVPLSAYSDFMDLFMSVEEKIEDTDEEETETEETETEEEESETEETEIAETEAETEEETEAESEIAESETEEETEIAETETEAETEEETLSAEEQAAIAAELALENEDLAIMDKAKSRAEWMFTSYTSGDFYYYPTDDYLAKDPSKIEGYGKGTTLAGGCEAYVLDGTVMYDETTDAAGKILKVTLTGTRTSVTQTIDEFLIMEWVEN